MPKPKDLSRILSPRRYVVFIYKILCNVNVELKCDIFYMLVYFVKYACMVLRKTGCDEFMLD